MMSMQNSPLILVAEDDPDDTLLLKDAFSDINQLAISFLTNGKLLIAQLKMLQLANNLPILIIIDLNMPVLDGRSVLKELKKNEATASIPVIVLSTTRNQTDIDEVMTLGAKAFFTKPATYSELVNIVNTISIQWLVKRNA